jgi:hypothetical protein
MGVVEFLPLLRLLKIESRGFGFLFHKARLSGTAGPQKHCSTKAIKGCNEALNASSIQFCYQQKRFVTSSKKISAGVK